MLYRKLRRPKTQESGLIKSESDMEGMRAAGKLVAHCFQLLHESIKPGIRLNELDQRVEALIRDAGAEPLYKGYRGSPPTNPPFASVICASINEQICHAPADERRLRKGDIVGIDIGLKLDGWCGDACVTYPVGQVSEEAGRLLQVSHDALYRGIDAAQPGNRLGAIAVAIESYANEHGYSVVKEWGGHGIGRKLHESPSIPHSGPLKQGMELIPGMIFTIEPMINIGRSDCHTLEDGWIVVTDDGSLSAQFEHTIIITKNGPEIITPWHTFFKLPASAEAQKSELSSSEEGKI